MDLKVEPGEMDCDQPPPIEVFANTSTLHGISHIFSYDRISIRRCLWLVFFLSSLTLLLYVCTDRIQFYLEYPHVTKLDEITTLVMVFPAVTFCNLNSFRFSKVTRNDLYHAGELLALLGPRCVSSLSWMFRLFFVSFSISPSLSLSHTHTYAHIHTRRKFLFENIAKYSLQFVIFVQQHMSNWMLLFLWSKH